MKHWKHVWLLIAAVAVIAIWPILTAVETPKAEAQLAPGPGFTYPRLCGPMIYSLGNRPLTLFGGGQFGYGYFPYAPGYGGPAPQTPAGVYLVPVDPSLLYASGLYPGTLGNMPPNTGSGALPGQTGIPTTGLYPIARTNDLFDATYGTDGKLLIRWQGEAAAARTVRFVLLDSRRLVLKEIYIEQLPAEARLDSNDKAAFVQAEVVYVNGTANTVLFPLKSAAGKATPTAPAANGDRPVKSAAAGGGVVGP